MDILESYVRVLYDFDYKTNDGKHIWMKAGEKLLLICKTNQDWWQVIRNEERRPFYAPASYVKLVVRADKLGQSLEGNIIKATDEKTNPETKDSNIKWQLDGSLGKMSCDMTNISLSRCDTSLHKQWRRVAGDLEYEPRLDLEESDKGTYRQRSNSMDNVVFREKIKEGRILKEIYKDSAYSQKCETSERMKKPRISKDVWERRKSWAMEDFRNLSEMQVLKSKKENVQMLQNADVGNMRNKSIESSDIYKNFAHDASSNFAFKTASLKTYPPKSYFQKITDGYMKPSLSENYVSGSHVLNKAYKGKHTVLSCTDRRTDIPPDIPPKLNKVQVDNSGCVDKHELRGYSRIAFKSSTLGSHSGAKLKSQVRYSTESLENLAQEIQFHTGDLHRPLQDETKNKTKPVVQNEGCVKTGKCQSSFNSFSEFNNNVKSLDSNNSQHNDVLNFRNTNVNSNSRDSGLERVKGDENEVEENGIIRSQSPALAFNNPMYSDDNLSEHSVNIADREVSEMFLCETEKPYVVSGIKYTPETSWQTAPVSPTCDILLDSPSITELNASDEGISSDEVLDYQDCTKLPTAAYKPYSQSSSKSPEKPVYANLPLNSPAHPPSPQLGERPLRGLFDDWEEYIDHNGRKFYFNTCTKEKSWKPPRKKGMSPNQEIKKQGSSGNISSERLNITRTPEPQSTPEHLNSHKPQETPELKNTPETESKIHVPVGEICFMEKVTKTKCKKQGSAGNLSSERLSVTKIPEPQSTPEHINSPASQETSRLSSTSETEKEIDIPPGWIQSYDEAAGEICFINSVTKTKWFTSFDSEARVYFFEENSNESSWTLPEVVVGSQESQQTHDSSLSPTWPLCLSKSSISDSLDDTSLQKHDRSVVSSVGDSPKDSGSPRLRVDRTERRTKSKSEVLSEIRGQLEEKKKQDTEKTSKLPKQNQWPNLQDGNIITRKKGALNKTKLTENGKKLRKNWSTSYVVLTDILLLLYKDERTFSQTITGPSWNKPELCIDLKGALIEWTQEKSSRKNVIQISTVLGLQLLLQDDSAKNAKEWFEAISLAISRLPPGFESHMQSKLSNSHQHLEPLSPETSSKFSKLGRSKSTRLKKLGNAFKNIGSSEDLTATAAERQTKVKAKLYKFFSRRPTMEILVKRGILKDEPVFGCFLDKLCSAEKTYVPRFVQKCIAVIESKPENLKTDGLYRASGNLAQVQKIRLQVDQDNLKILEEEEDVHVLGGALKLFFRELKEPLIPCCHFQNALRASTTSNRKEQVQLLQDIVNSLPQPNYETLKFLMEHLLKVTEYCEFNRMHVANVAIVFGPSLMWPEQESQNMALDMIQQNLVIECLLQEYHSVFR